MIKITDCTELNPFDHFNILDNIEDMKITKLLTIINNKTAKFETKHINNNCYMILHKSTKHNNKIQVSYFKNDIAYSDSEHTNYYEAIKNCGLFSYQLKEVI